MMLFNAYPKAAEVKTYYGWLTLHLALYYKASDDVITMIFKAYPEATQVQTNYGCLPLHYALYYKASSDVITMIFSAYPKAAEVQDNNGQLPLHCALRYTASADIINILLKAYPRAAEVQDKHGELPLHSACTVNDSLYAAFPDVIKMIFEAFPLAAQVKNRQGETPLDVAASSGIYLNVLQLFNDENKNAAKDHHDQGKVQGCQDMQRLGKEEEDKTSMEIKCLRAEIDDIRLSIAEMKHEITSDMKQMLRSFMDEIHNKPNP